MDAKLTRNPMRKAWSAAFLAMWCKRVFGCSRITATRTIAAQTMIIWVTSVAQDNIAVAFEASPVISNYLTIFLSLGCRRR